MSRAYVREMVVPPLTTHKLRTAIEAKRRADAQLRWAQAFRPAHPGIARRDVPIPRSTRA
jgi:hypothetical protein